jgi:hypothetical protein
MVIIVELTGHPLAKSWMEPGQPPIKPPVEEPGLGRAVEAYSKELFLLGTFTV